MYQAHFDNVLLESDGWVVDTQKCLAVRNGGCERYQAWKNRNNFQTVTSGGKTKFLSNSVEDQAEIHKRRLWQKVVSIAQSRATWHYTMENLLGLASIDLNILRGGPLSAPGSLPYVLHIASFSIYTIQWLQVVLGPETRLCMIMDPSQLNTRCIGKEGQTFQLRKDDPTHYVYVTSGIVLTKHSIVPEMGRCGHPSAQQLLWLRDKVSSYLAWHIQYRARFPEGAYKGENPSCALRCP